MPLRSLSVHRKEKSEYRRFWKATNTDFLAFTVLEIGGDDTGFLNWRRPGGEAVRKPLLAFAQCVCGKMQALLLFVHLFLSGAVFILTLHVDPALAGEQYQDRAKNGISDSITAGLESTGRQLKLVQLSLPAYDVNYQGPSQAAALSLKSGGSTRFDRRDGTLGRNSGVSVAYAFAAEPPPAVRLFNDGLRGFASDNDPIAITDTYLLFENDGSIRGGARAEAEGSLLSITNAHVDLIEDEIHLEGNNQARSRATASASTRRRRSGSGSALDGVQSTQSSVEAAVNALAMEDFASADQDASANTRPDTVDDQCSQAEVLGEAIADGRLREDFVNRIRLDWRCQEESSDAIAGAQGKELLQAQDKKLEDGSILSSRLRPMGRRVTMSNRYLKGRQT